MQQRWNDRSGLQVAHDLGVNRDRCERPRLFERLEWHTYPEG